MTFDPDRLRTLETLFAADPRNESFAVIEADSIRPKTLEDHFDEIRDINLQDCVPLEIQVQFDTCKNLYLYSWFAYRFYPIARLQALTCVELGLRSRFEEDMIAEGASKQKFGPGLRRLLRFAIKKGYLKNENFEHWRHRVRVKARMRTMYEAVDEMYRQGVSSVSIDESAIRVEEADKDYDYLEGLLESLPWLRNLFAHGSISVDNQVQGTIHVAAEIINQIYSD